MVEVAPVSLHQLLAAEWKRARDSRMVAARIAQDMLARRSLIRVARRANHERVMYLRQVREGVL